MKTRLLGIAVVLAGAMAFTSCEKDDDLHSSDVPAAVLDSFDAKYPNVSRAEWEKKGGYIVAEFWQDGMDTQAWYNSNGEWLMTEFDLGRNVSALPQAVQEAFQNSAYATWRVDEIDLYERPKDAFYLIEVETQGQTERDLYFAPDGTLLKDEADRENHEVTPDIVF